MALEFGGWAPVCGSWLRTRDAKRNPTASAVVRLARTLERLGYDFYYVPEHYLNAIHGPSESVLDAWVVSAASVVATRRIRVITAVQPGFKAPGVVAKMGATLAGIRAGAFGLSLIAGWWRLEVENYDDVWLPHAERYARASEFLDVIRGFWSEERWSYQGKYYRVPGGRLEPKPLPPPPIRSLMPAGYTIPEFVRERFGGARFAVAVVIIGALFGSLIEIIINLKGTALVTSAVFGVDPNLAAVIGLAVVLAYSAVGGLWSSVSTSTVSTLLHTVPPAVIVVAALYKAGGATAIWSSVAAQGNGYLSITRTDAPAAFGITLALGLITATVAGQEYWQLAWGLKRKDVSRTFLWAGAWFYPIPICLGILGLVGIGLNVDLSTQLGGDAAAIGPYLISHLGLPSWIVFAYVVVILTACYSVIDSAFTAISSVFVVDVIKPLAPSISDRSLFVWAKAPMVLGAAIAALVVLTGADFVTIVLTSYAIRTAILVPLVLSLFWSRMTGAGFVWGTIGGIAIGMPVRSAYGELAGSLTILAVSSVIPVVLGLASSERFDFEKLEHLPDATGSSHPDSKPPLRAASPAE